MRGLWQTVLISLALGAAALWFVVPETFSPQTLYYLGRAKLWALGLALLSVLLWWLTAGYRIRFLTRSTGDELSFWQGIQTHIMGVFSSAVTPAGGGNSFGIAWLLTRFGVNLDGAVTVSVLCVVGDLAFFAWAVPLSFVLLYQAGISLPVAHLGWLVLALSLAAFIASYLLVFRLRYAVKLLDKLLQFPFLRRFRERTKPFQKNLTTTSEEVAALPLSFHLVFHGLSSLARIFYFSPLIFILLAFQIEPEALVFYGVQIIIHTFAFLVPTPGASGYQELALGVALKGMISNSLLSAVVILWRFAGYYLYFLAGPPIGGAALLKARRKSDADGARRTSS